jgi:hypothetical protein
VETRACPACGARALVLGSVGNLALERCGSCGGVCARVEEAPRWWGLLAWTSLGVTSVDALLAAPSWLDWLIYRARRRSAWPPRVPWESNLAMDGSFEDAVLRGDVAAVRRALEAGGDVDARNAQA